MKKLIAIALCAALTSCASICNSKSETITLTSNVENTRILITDKKHKPVYNTVLPAQVELDKKAGYFSGQTYTLTAEKEGYQSVTKELDTSMSAWYYLGNLGFGLIGGAIGWLGVDPATGAMWNFDEESFHFDMQKKAQ